MDDAELPGRHVPYVRSISTRWPHDHPIGDWGGIPTFHDTDVPQLGDQLGRDARWWDCASPGTDAIPVL